ncbi:KCNAB1 [Branchiostoma lanceolatum]|uniref:KCNAB1 protein n=1 Tax=Branchiostoma lanceolatum TaxID=7740 RepID=A0A8K0EIS9_BRALA|nr:KCNAB1 [Branchiostoma lanceolatum]
MFQMAELDTVSQMDAFYPYNMITKFNSDRVRKNLCHQQLECTPLGVYCAGPLSWYLLQTVLQTVLNYKNKFKSNGSTLKIDMADKTEYRFLGGSGLKVSNICLGATSSFTRTLPLHVTSLAERALGPFCERCNVERKGPGERGWGAMTFGEWDMFPGQQCDEAASHAILDRYVELGGNFIDTADRYGGGKSEEIVGSWMEKQEREKVVVATKVGFNTGKDINRMGLSRHHIMQSIDDSLRRLRTDYVDLYQIHMWDRAVPLEETLSALNDLVRTGKVRYLGASNVTGWQLQKIVDLSKSMGLNKWISLQAEYSLLHRGIEWELTDVCREEGIGIIPWSPLKGGLLTGKFERECDAPEGTRIWHATKTKKINEAAPDFEKVKKDDKTWDILNVMKKVAEAQDKTVAQVAIRWLLQKDVVSSVIIGAKTVQQLEDNMGASTGWEITEEQMAELDTVSQMDPLYPYNLIAQLNSDRVRKNLCQ